jgi:hypothetical protein
LLLKMKRKMKQTSPGLRQNPLYLSEIRRLEPSFLVQRTKQNMCKTRIKIKMALSRLKIKRLVLKMKKLNLIFKGYQVSKSLCL